VAHKLQWPAHVASPYIDFISAYCDRWCERCAFTSRCSTYAITSAVTMCDGDIEAAIELAIGQPQVPGEPPKGALGERMAEKLAGFHPTGAELEEAGREEDERADRVERHPLAEASLDYAVAAGRWLTEHDDCREAADQTLRQAVEVASWDHHLIHVKIVRALDGRDEYPTGASFEQSAVQSDWNGSAKVAIISIERSARAWRLVAGATGDESAGVLAHNLIRLHDAMHAEFPRAMAFRRPGFDKRPRRGVA
jgi:hypothetical protein